MREVGIESMAGYVPAYALRLDELARARGVDPEKYRVGLGVEAMAITPPWEDPVTLAANAAAPLFESGRVGRDEIGLLLVATESAVDHARPIASFVHELLRIAPACRTYEIKHACYGGTAALMTASQWIASGAARGRKALIVATDIARYGLGSAGEPTQGAGAVAMVVSNRPDALAIDFRSSGSFAEGVFDFWRPLDRREALVDGKYSVDCYLKALAGAYADFVAAAEPLGDVLGRHRAFLYHTPFPKMAWKAHRELVGLDRAGDDATALDDRAARSYEMLVAPYLELARRIGNTYTASLYFALLDLVGTHGDRLHGEPIALFSYGSGCCAELFRGFVGGPGGADAASLRARLDSRCEVSIEEYETMRAAGAPSFGGFQPPAGVRGGFVFAGLDRERRRYLPVS